MRRPGWLLFCAMAGLQACSFNQPAAPIRNAHRHGHAIRHPAPPTADFVIVQPGDTLFRIAFDHGLDYRELAQWNGLNDPSRIFVGSRLRLTPPTAAPKPVKTIVVDKLPGSNTPDVVAKPLPPPAPATSGAESMPGDTPSSWIWPAQGQVVTEFNETRGAKGIDIAGKPDSPILAAASGRVVYVGGGLRGYGKLIIIKHSDILISAYGHNDRVLVTEGQPVRQGQLIAEMGDTDADRVKLHFEIREYGKPVDPMMYLSGSAD
jgi:lipoprotein NlpD